MLRSHLCLAWALALCGCSASIPVTHMKSGKPPVKGEGVLLTLPRTVLTLSYSVSEKTFSAGTWTAEIEACEKAVKNWSDAETAAQDACVYLSDPNVASCGDKDQRKQAEEKVKAMLDGIPDTCRKSQELGLSSLRFSRVDSMPACTSDGGTNEFRRVFDKSTFAVVASGETDPDHVYWVSTPVKTFGDAQVDVAYTERGVVSGAKVASSNPFLGFAVDVSGIAIKAVLSGFGSGPVKKAADGAVTPTCVLVGGTDCVAYKDALRDFEKLLENKMKGASGISAGNFDGHIKLIDAGIAERRKLFTGSVEVTPSPKTLRWLPLSSDTSDSECGTTKLEDLAYEGRCSTITIPSCRAVKDSVAGPKIPGYRLTFQASTTKASKEWLAVAEETLLDTNEDADRNEAILKKAERERAEKAKAEKEKARANEAGKQPAPNPGADADKDECKKASIGNGGGNSDTGALAADGKDGSRQGNSDGKSAEESDPENYGRREDRGFPYRVPAVAEVTVSVTRHKDIGCATDAGAASGAMTPAQLTIAQYGLVGRLTPRAGGRKSTIDTKYFETGALQSVSVIREGQDPAPILDPIKQALQPKSSPSELDQLKAQKDYLEAQKAICDAAVSLNTTPPDFCKLPSE